MCLLSFQTVGLIETVKLRPGPGLLPFVCVQIRGPFRPLGSILHGLPLVSASLYVLRPTDPSFTYVVFDLIEGSFE